MHRLAVLSMHTSPLEQPGVGDGGGMNVYVRELSSALARAGVVCDVYTRASSPHLPSRVVLEPGLVVHHIPAGPLEAVPKARLHDFVDEFAAGVERRITNLRNAGSATDAIHANYWLSGVAGHRLKHRLGLPLVVTFHTLDRVKAIASPEDIDPADPNRRARCELEIIDCADAVLASCTVEAGQLVDLYGAVQSRVEIVAPGVDHAFFSPGDRSQARRAIRVDHDGPLILYVGRIQPLKGADIALQSLGLLVEAGLSNAALVVVGGPSGPNGEKEMASLRRLGSDLGLSDRVHFVAPVPHELLCSYYRAADCCLVPSRSESFGLVALEAAACGTPVVASAVGGLTTLIDEGATGCLVDEQSPEAFAKRLLEVFQDEDRRAAMGRAAALRARTYTWSIAAARLRRLYAELTERSLVECR